jgi:hypothetical protein
LSAPRELAPSRSPSVCFLPIVFNLISIGMLLPLISIAGGITTDKPSSLSLIVTGVSTWLGLKPDLDYLLLFLAISLSIKSVLSFLAMSYAAVAMAEVSAQVRRLLVSAMLRVRWSYYMENIPEHFPMPSRARPPNRQAPTALPQTPLPKR